MVYIPVGLSLRCRAGREGIIAYIDIFALNILFGILIKVSTFKAALKLSLILRQWKYLNENFYKLLGA